APRANAIPHGWSAPGRNKSRGFSAVSSPAPIRSKAQGRDVTAKDLLDAGARRIMSELAGQPCVQAALLETIAQAYQHLGLKAESEDMFRQQARAEEAGSGGDSAGLARALRQLGDVERQRSRLADAEADLRRALAAAGKSGAELESAHTLNNLGLVLEAR